jgi:hypothetical protein
VCGAQQTHEHTHERDGGERPQRDVHVGDERRELLRREALGDAREDREERRFRDRGGDDAITNAIDRTAPVFCSSVRAPAAIPRRCAGTTPIMAAVLGLLNMPEPTPTMAATALCQ